MDKSSFWEFTLTADDVPLIRTFVRLLWLLGLIRSFTHTFEILDGLDKECFEQFVLLVPAKIKI